ncbi:MAG: radical SAM family heme chaperone HemW [Thiotrichales bacterium]|nr:radical SAM family heme chaperone HemW [Thiotrichales bacterium]
MLHFTEPLPLSLYVHLPWCVKKCPYCDFNSYAADSEVPDNEYVAALVRDLESALPQIWGRRVESIFLGGGTPSLFSGAAIRELLNRLHARLNFNPAIEITLEANPGTVDAGHFHAYRRAGINRLSLGVQSFSDSRLSALGRIHDSAQAVSAYDSARTAGFDNINIDLMFGLPGQSPAAAMQDLQQAIELAPEHISWYQLTIEPNTYFYKKPPELPGEDHLWDIQCAGLEFLQQHGYQQYEVSAHARDGRQCRHNLNYWHFGDYLGIGAGAHSKLTDIRRQCIRRMIRHRNPDGYLQRAGSASAIVSDQALAMHDVPLEFMLNALRLTAGFPSRLFLQRTGLPLNRISTALEQAEHGGYLHWDEKQIVPTDKGRHFLNDLLQLFMPEEAAVHSPAGQR